MKKLLLATTIAATMVGSAMAAENIKIGVILGFTGPIESLTPDMATGAEMAMKEISDSGALLGGATLESIRADSTCVDAAAATANAEKLITSVLNFTDGSMPENFSVNLFTALSD